MSDYHNVFFSFKYTDATLAARIRQSNEFVSREDMGFVDWADWEKVRSKDTEAIKRWIDNQLVGSSVTVVLIGQETASSDWVNYEISKSFKERKGLLGIQIHNMKALTGFLALGNSPGPNPFLRHNYDTLADCNPDQFLPSRNLLAELRKEDGFLGHSYQSSVQQNRNALAALIAQRGVLNTNYQQQTSTAKNQNALAEIISMATRQEVSPLRGLLSPTLASVVRIYDWEADHGYKYLKTWIREARDAALRRT